MLQRRVGIAGDLVGARLKRQHRRFAPDIAKLAEARQRVVEQLATLGDPPLGQQRCRAPAVDP